MTGKPWTALRTLELRALALDGLTAEQIGRHFGVSRDCARGKARRMGLTLRHAPNTTHGRPKPTSSYIDHHDERSGAVIHNWRDHTRLNLAWCYGDALAAEVVAGHDAPTQLDIARWRGLGQARAAA